jgi:hypothetical protein
MRAKTINEIKRGGDSLQSMNVGTSRVSPALAYVREICPGCISSVTLTERISRFGDRTHDHYRLGLCMAEFSDKVGDTDDFLTLDFNMKLSGDFEYEMKFEKNAIRNKYFADKFNLESSMKEVFEHSNDAEMYTCYYDVVNCIGSIDMSNEEGRAYVSCYFVKV